MKKWILTSLLFYFVGATPAPAQQSKNFFKDKTKIENPFNLRDPFKAPTFKNEAKRDGRGFSVTGKGQYSNISEDNLEQMNLADIRVVGVLIGKERRAMISTGAKADRPSGESSSGNKVIIVKEGTKIGPEAAELKAILPGGIVLVEKIVNVYGEEEYLETVIPISR